MVCCYYDLAHEINEDNLCPNGPYYAGCFMMQMANCILCCTPGLFFSRGKEALCTKCRDKLSSRKEGCNLSIVDIINNMVGEGRSVYPDENMDLEERSRKHICDAEFSYTPAKRQKRN